jgi:hypothetical protein
MYLLWIISLISSLLHYSETSSSGIICWWYPISKCKFCFVVFCSVAPLLLLFVLCYVLAIFFWAQMVFCYQISFGVWILIESGIQWEPNRISYEGIRQTIQFEILSVHLLSFSFLLSFSPFKLFITLLHKYQYILHFKKFTTAEINTA